MLATRSVDEPSGPAVYGEEHELGADEFLELARAVGLAEAAALVVP